MAADKENDMCLVNLDKIDSDDDDFRPPKRKKKKKAALDRFGSASSEKEIAEITK